MDLPKDKDLLKNGYQFLGFDKEKKCWGVMLYMFLLNSFKL
ncbi:hypothetical protein BTH41_02150 [Bacillus mycoides]|nr:hypothetical protein BTH41_02150 [Bacillus mycoides]